MKNFEVIFAELIVREEKAREDLAQFFIDEWFDDITRYHAMTEDDIKAVAKRGVEYWYSGETDDEQWDCLMLAVRDWERENMYGEDRG